MVQQPVVHKPGVLCIQAGQEPLLVVCDRYVVACFGHSMGEVVVQVADIDIVALGVGVGLGR